MTSTHYRFIDGLRAMAILPVVLFHISSQMAPGGYLGVDIFFVISGFVITNSLIQSSSDGKINLLLFWEKRIRRLIPASSLVLLTSFLMALVVMSPEDAVIFGRSMIAAALFHANIYFANTLDYFAAPANQHPLLHFWSLSVEEQFYFVWPVLLGLAVKLLPAHRRLAASLCVLALTLISLGLLLFSPLAQSDNSFYFLSTRVWELGTGALAALLLPQQNKTVPFASLFAGLAGLIILVSLFALSEDYHLPGPLTIPLVLSTAVLIWLGVQKENITTRFLTFRPFVWIGLISYGVYLWHWPLFSFARLAYGEELSPLVWALLVVATFLIAYVSWRYVETPIRRWKGAIIIKRQGLVVGSGILSLLTVSLLGGSLMVTRGMPWRLPSWEQEIYRQEYSENSYRDACDSWQKANNRNDYCDLNGHYDPKHGFDVFVIGSSYADHLVPGLEVWAKQQNLSVRQVTNSTCSGVPGMDRPDYRRVQMCRDYHEELKKRIIANPNLKLVILSNHFHFTEPFDDLVASGDRFARAFVDFANWLDERHIRLLVATPVQGGMNLRAACVKQAVLKPGTQCGTAKKASTSTTEAFYEAAAAKLPNVEIRKVTDAMCSDTFCNMVKDGILLYRNAGHLNAYGSRWLVSKMHLPALSTDK